MLDFRGQPESGHASALDSVVEQGGGGGARLLTTRIYPHSDADGSRSPAECQKPSGYRQEVPNCPWASHKIWEVKRTRWMRAYMHGALRTTLSRHTRTFRSRLGTYKRATCSPAILPNPNHLTTPMSHPTSHEVLAFVTGPPTVAGLQRITLKTQRIPRLVLQNPTAFFPSNPHPHLVTPWATSFAPDLALIYEVLDRCDVADIVCINAITRPSSRST